MATMNDDHGRMPAFRPSPIVMEDIPDEEEWNLGLREEDTGHMAGTTPPSVSAPSGGSNSFESPDNAGAGHGVASAGAEAANPSQSAAAAAHGGSSLGWGHGMPPLPNPGGALRVSGLHFLAPHHMPSLGHWQSGMGSFEHSWHPHPAPPSYAAMAGPSGGGLSYPSQASVSMRSLMSGVPGNEDGGMPSLPAASAKPAGRDRTSPLSSDESSTVVADARSRGPGKGFKSDGQDGNSSPSSGNDSNASSDAHSDTWTHKLELLRQYKAENGGSTDVPQSQKPLGTWVNKQRMEKKKLDKGERTSMTTDRKARLEAIGFKWAKAKGQANWDMRFKELKAFKKEFGHCNVPTKPKDLKYKALGRWVTSQRYDKKNGNLTNANERRLKRIGFTWNRYEQS